jgi:hypothetical protein
MVEDHWTQIVAVSEALLRLETLQRDEVERLMRGETVERPTVAEMLSKKAIAPTVPAVSDEPPMGNVVPRPA